MKAVVGERYPIFKRPDGVYLLYGETGIRLVYIMADPDDEEIQSLKAGTEMNIRMGVVGNSIVWCVKPVGQPWSDCTFVPRVEPNLPYDIKLADKEGLVLTIELYDGATGELKNIRLVSLPHGFSEQFLKNCRMLVSRNVSMEEIRTSYASIMRRTTAELVKICDFNAKVGGDA